MIERSPLPHRLLGMALLAFIWFSRWRRKQPIPQSIPGWGRCFTGPGHNDALDRHAAAIFRRWWRHIISEKATQEPAVCGQTRLAIGVDWPHRFAVVFLS
jgi:hypothetical protein